MQQDKKEQIRKAISHLVQEHDHERGYPKRKHFYDKSTGILALEICINPQGDRVWLVKKREKNRFKTVYCEGDYYQDKYEAGHWEKQIFHLEEKHKNETMDSARTRIQ